MCGYFNYNGANGRAGFGAETCESAGASCSRSRGETGRKRKVSSASSRRKDRQDPAHHTRERAGSALYRGGGYAAAAKGRRQAEGEHFLCFVFAGWRGQNSTAHHLCVQWRSGFV